ncbi:MAG: heavy metal translocating P-type ATPase [Zoogloeaceae bacterium]|jgi:Cu2+-exporting ATPase|nr:heavy metal translocating P-type ATPase [Zoogloeaceae bacterium]
MSETCYHCGLAIPAGIDFPVEIDNRRREMCCAGCQAVAQAIVTGGLIDYYRHRDALPESPREAMPQALQELGLFDHPDVQKNFVRPTGEHEREAALILEGITCAACVWLNEQHIARQSGVTAVDINYATRRARVRWDERRIKLSQILEAIVAIGYRAHPYDVARSELIARKERKAALWRLFVAGFGMMQVMMYAVPVYLADEGTMSADIEQLMRWASLILTLPVVLYSSAPFFAHAWRDLKLRRVGMDVPVALGIGSAFAASLWATLTASGEVYFDSVTMFVFLLLGGRFLEMVARQKAARGVEELARALPAFAARYTRFPDGEIERVAVSNLAAGDVVLVSPGEVIPADGTVIEGASSADESLLTGESRAISKRQGDAVIGGSLNVSSPLTLKVDRVGEATRLASIQRLMERAAAEKPKIVETADRIAARFVSVLLLLALATGAWWWWADSAQALWVFVSVLVVSCPCALSLATPAALTVATGVLSRHGVLVTRGHAIETLARATHFVFDKTGTLTEGHPVLMETVTLGRLSDAQSLALAAEMETGSEHPIGRAISVAAAELAERQPMGVRGIEAITGQGIEAEWEGVTARLGSPGFVGALCASEAPAVLQEWQAHGDTIVALGSAAGWLAAFRLADKPRAGTAEAMAALRSLRIEVSALSGDAPETVARIANDLGIAAASGGMTPEGKHEAIRQLQAQGGTVAMVGDGVNDAPVLAQAHVSVAMGGGTDLARSQADIVLLSNDLRHLASGVTIARRTMMVIRQNLTWAFAYNLIAIPLAMAGWVTPWLAGVGMSVSSLLVVLNALRLQRSASVAANGSETR